MRDRHTCTVCGWHHANWNSSDPRHLELHHTVHHSKGGANSESNLVTLCTVCHRSAHSQK
nr:HNH endonuclease [Pseudomonas lundensis]